MPSSSKTSNKFSKYLLAWYDEHGRKDLPWRKEISPYRVWISEIMLQQTQVATVIPYFQRFIQSFPNLQSLALASQDLVLQHWAGLGYYARARNLHKTAQILVNQFQGQFPENLFELQQLPGIGRSTAGAILAIAFNKPAPILDGNVKRVLARWYAIQGWPGETLTANKLWAVAEKLVPEVRCDDYTQALMDFGALICTKAQPKCEACFVANFCGAYQLNQQHELPTPKPYKALPLKTTQILLIMNLAKKTLLLERRPPTGIWGGLWSPAQCAEEFDPILWCAENLNCQVELIRQEPKFRHTFTHFHLEIRPVLLKFLRFNLGVAETKDQIWYDPAQPSTYGLPAPIKRLIQNPQLFS